MCRPCPCIFVAWRKGRKFIRYQKNWEGRIIQVEGSGHRSWRILQERCGKVTVSCRKTLEIAETWKQYSGRKLSEFFPVDSCQLPVVSFRNWPEIIGKKSGTFPARKLLPCSSDFQCLPAGTGLCFLTWGGLDNFMIGDINDYFKRENTVRVKNGRLRQKKRLNTEKRSFHWNIEHLQRKNAKQSENWLFL